MSILPRTPLDRLPGRCALGLLAALAAGCSGSAELLTPEERAWVRAHPQIRIAPTRDYAPVEYLDEGGAHRGFTAEVIGRLGELLDLDFDVVDPSREERLHPGPYLAGVDAVPVSAATPKRLEHWRFTRPYLELPAMILTRAGAPQRSSLADLRGHRVAVVEGYAIQEMLATEHPDVESVTVEDDRAGLHGLAVGEFDAFLSDLAVATHVIERDGLVNLRIAGPSGFVYRMGIASRRDWPLLPDILDKGLAAITADEWAGMRERWLGAAGAGLPAEQRRSGFPLAPLLVLLVVPAAAFTCKQVEIRRRTRRELAGSLASGVAHDLNNILGVIRGQGELLALGETHPEASSMVLRATDRASRLTRRLAHLGQNGGGEARPVDVGAFLAEWTPFLRAALGKRIAVTSFAGSDAPHALIDPLDLEEILLNLATNARDALGGVGRLRISAREEGGRVEIHVEDDGPGMDARVRRRAFRTGYSTKAGGRGLGLAHVRRLVRRNGGRIACHEANPRGTRFEIRLPAARMAVR